MRSVRSTLAVLAASLAAICASAGEPKFRSERLSKDETKALFAKLNKAAATAKTFHARILRSELSGYVIDEEPVRSEGEVWAVRPDRFRQQRSKPRKSLAVINPKEVWIYFPESREAQHVDFAKGVAGKAGMAAESFMSWVTFDLAEIEKRYRVSVRTAEVPEGVTIRIAKSARKGAPAPKAAAAPAKAYRITYTPLASHRKKSAVRSLSLWVDGENAWPLKVEKVTKSGVTITTEFRDMVLEEELDPDLFKFTPPRGTKEEELSG
ncbi:MAG: LolA family protein [Planctomycetota bacterium]|jgi:outer membrane lipoprotein-sorting protein